MPSTASKRLAAFQARAAFAPKQVLAHRTSGWRYIAIHPFADDHDLLARLGWPAEQCLSVDAYWEHAGDVYLLQMHADGNDPPGDYYRWVDHGGYVVNLVTKLPPEPVIREAFEGAMSRLVAALPIRDKVDALTPVRY